MLREKSQIDEFAAMVYPRDGHPKILAMIEAYLDESGIHSGATVCVIAGYFGGNGQWKKMGSAWEKTLRKNGLSLADFHAKDTVKSRKHQPLLKELSMVISSHRKIHPVSFAVSVNDFNSFSFLQRQFLTGSVFRGNKQMTSGCPRKPYFVPFQNCIKRVADHAPVGGKAHFFFGLDRPFAEYATEMFREIKEILVANSDWKTKDRVGIPSFPLAAETSQLQAADLLVHLSYQFFLDEQEAKSTDLKPSPLLRECLRNILTIEDFAFQDRSCLEETIRRARLKAGDGWRKELGESIAGLTA